MKKSVGPPPRKPYAKWLYICEYLDTRPLGEWYEEEFESRWVANGVRTTIYAWFKRHPRRDGRGPEIYSKGDKPCTLYFRLAQKEQA